MVSLCASVLECVSLIFLFSVFLFCKRGGLFKCICTCVYEYMYVHFCVCICGYAFCMWAKEHRQAHSARCTSLGMHSGIKYSRLEVSGA